MLLRKEASLLYLSVYNPEFCKSHRSDDPVIFQIIGGLKILDGLLSCQHLVPGVPARRSRSGLRRGSRSTHHYRSGTRTFRRQVEADCSERPPMGVLGPPAKRWRWPRFLRLREVPCGRTAHPSAMLENATASTCSEVLRFMAMLFHVLRRCSVCLERPGQ